MNPNTSSPTGPLSLKKLGLLFLAVTVAGAMSSCSTVAGLGRDTQKVGAKIEQKAHEVAN